MDGHFVPNSAWAAVVQGLRRVTRLPLEVHLMVIIRQFVTPSFQAGADSLLVHQEVCPSSSFAPADSWPGKESRHGCESGNRRGTLEPYLKDIDLAYA